MHGKNGVEHEMRFLASGLRTSLAGIIGEDPIRIRQVYLLDGWRIRKCHPEGLPLLEGITYELNLKRGQEYAVDGVTAQELEQEIVHQEVFDYMTAHLSDPFYGPIEKVRKRYLSTSGLVIECDAFDERWVLDGADYLAEVEFNPAKFAVADVVDQVKALFENVVNISDQERYGNKNIARRLKNGYHQRHLPL